MIIGQDEYGRDIDHQFGVKPSGHEDRRVFVNNCLDRDLGGYGPAHNSDKSPAEVIAHMLTRKEPFGALLFLDDVYVLSAATKSQLQKALPFVEAQFGRRWSELAIMVYKPRHQGYIRETYMSR